MKLAAVMAVWMAMPGGPARRRLGRAGLFADDFNRARCRRASATAGASGAVDVSLVVRAGSDREMQLRDDDPRGVASRRSGISTLRLRQHRPGLRLGTEQQHRSRRPPVDRRDRANADGPWTAIASGGVAGRPDAHRRFGKVVGAGDIADFEFGFRVAVDSNNEGALIDNVMLAPASALRVQAVPEPGSLALAGVALVLLSAGTPVSAPGPTVRVR